MSMLLHETVIGQNVCKYKRTLTDIDEADSLLPHDEVQRHFHVLHALCVHARLLAVAPDLLLRESLHEHDEAYPVAEVSGELLDGHHLHLEVLVAPSRERLLLDALPLRVHMLVAGHADVVPAGESACARERKREGQVVERC